MIFRILATCAVLVSLLSVGYGTTTRASLPSQGVVPNEEIAVKIAEAVFPPVFGAEEVSKYSPYHAALRDGVWTVYGTLQPNARGGTPMMTIQKNDGKVTEIWFSQ